MSNERPNVIKIPNNGSHNINIKPPPRNVIMIFIINATKNEQKVDLKEKIKLAVLQVFKQNSIERKLDNWTIKTRDGIQLEFNKSYIDQGIVKREELFLTKGPGRGG